MDNPLRKKFQLKEEYSVLLLNSNPSVHPLFEGIRVQFEGMGDHSFDSVIFFARDEQEINQQLPKAEANRKPKGNLWLSYPKKSGSIPTELNRDSTWKAVLKFDMEPVRLISVNDDWSSMRLIKASERAKKSKLGQDPPGVDRTTKTATPPEDLQKVLEANPLALQFFEDLAFSHKREYLAWIHDAKKPETRERRIQKTIELLTAGKKTK